jgi:phosphopantothenoylcysteine decarboxylase
MNILLGVTGSVAATLYSKIVTGLQSAGDVKVVFTQRSLHFTSQSPLLNSELVKGYTDEQEWQWRKKGDIVLHISLRDWADVLVIAPLSANTLAKMANGLCDNLLTSVYRAWPIYKPIVLAPAMNTEMWKHPITGEHLERLRIRHTHGIKKYLYLVNPVEKELACGTTGVGAMADIKDIVSEVVSSTKAG